MRRFFINPLRFRRHSNENEVIIETSLSHDEFNNVNVNFDVNGDVATNDPRTTTTTTTATTAQFHNGEAVDNEYTVNEEYFVNSNVNVSGDTVDGSIMEMEGPGTPQQQQQQQQPQRRYPPQGFSPLRFSGALATEDDQPVMVAGMECGDVEIDLVHLCGTSIEDSQNNNRLPRAFVCPLTSRLLVDPVVTADGTTYERQTLLDAGVLSDSQLYPNRALRALLEQCVHPVTSTDHDLTNHPDKDLSNENENGRNFLVDQVFQPFVQSIHSLWTCLVPQPSSSSSLSSSYLRNNDNNNNNEDVHDNGSTVNSNGDYVENDSVVTPTYHCGAFTPPQSCTPRSKANDHRHRPNMVDVKTPKMKNTSTVNTNNTPKKEEPLLWVYQRGDSLPRELYCPITTAILRDPVIDPEGFTYERVAVTGWVRLYHTSPITRTPLAVHQLYDNRALRSLLEYEKRRSDDSICSSIQRQMEHYNNNSQNNNNSMHSNDDDSLELWSQMSERQHRLQRLRQERQSQFSNEHDNSHRRGRGRGRRHRHRGPNGEYRYYPSSSMELRFGNVRIHVSRLKVTLALTLVVFAAFVGMVETSKHLYRATACRVPDPSKLGDGVCDGGLYFTALCHYDYGDCDNCSRQVPSMAQVGDGKCHGGPYLTSDCGYDGGDCIRFLSDYPNCTVTRPFWIGDGLCDGDPYNSHECGYDGGDCLEYNRKYPNCTVRHPWWIGDGHCNDLSSSTTDTIDNNTDNNNNSNNNNSDNEGTTITNASVTTGQGQAVKISQGGGYNTSECGYDGGDCLGLR